MNVLVPLNQFAFAIIIIIFIFISITNVSLDNKI